MRKMRRNPLTEPAEQRVVPGPNPLNPTPLPGTSTGMATFGSSHLLPPGRIIRPITVSRYRPWHRGCLAGRSELLREQRSVNPGMAIRLSGPFGDLPETVYWAALLKYVSLIISIKMADIFCEP